MTTLLGSKPPRTAAVQVRPGGTDPAKTSAGDSGTHSRMQSTPFTDLLNAERQARSRAERVRDYREILEDVVELARSAEVIVDFAYGARDEQGDEPEDQEEGGGGGAEFEGGFFPKFPPWANPDVVSIASAAWTDLDLNEWGRGALYEAITLGDSATRLLFERDGRLAGEQSIPPEDFQIRVNPTTRAIDHYRWNARFGGSEALLMSPFEIIHYPHERRRGEFYGRSIFSAVRGLRRRHEAIDDILAVLALRKASGDIYWLWPFGSKVPASTTDAWINQALDRAAMDHVFDDGGSLRRRAAQSVETAPRVVPYKVLEDYPDLNMKPTAVQVEPPNMRQLVELMEHYQGRLFIATGVPKALAGSEKDVNSRATLEQQGVHFSLTIHNKQKAIARKKRDIMVRACLCAGVVPRAGEIKVQIPKVSAFDEAIRATVSRERALAVHYLVQSGTSLHDALLLTHTAGRDRVESLEAEIEERNLGNLEDQLSKK